MLHTMTEQNKDEKEEKRRFIPRVEMKGLFRGKGNKAMGKCIPNSTYVLPEYEESEFNSSSNHTSCTGTDSKSYQVSMNEKSPNFDAPVTRAHSKNSVQAQVYNFLERPTGWKCFIYHFTVFMMVLICLIFSVLSTIEDYDDFAMETLFWMEIVLVAFFGLEYAIRLWSSGCRSKYMGIRGRIRFAKKPISIIGTPIKMLKELIFRRRKYFTWKEFGIHLCIVKLIKALSHDCGGVRFLQILRMLHVDRQGGTWRLLGSVIYLHRQELITTLYIGFLGLIFSSYFVYLAERSDKRKDFNSYADALWWGVITVMTIGYGDKVPQTWVGKIVASCFAVFAISFFALPAGILGSGFALKVQQKQRQKHFNRQIPAAATLIQCVWRCFAADPSHHSEATWKIHIHDASNEENMLARMARRASLTLRKRRSSRMDSLGNHYRESMSSVCTEDKLAGTPRNPRRDYQRQCSGSSTYHSNSITGDTYMDDNDYDNEEAEKVVQLTDAHKTAIRVIRKIKYFVARRKFQQARKPYDVRDVIEQYSQGHLNMMVRIKELQRRLDQTLGKPSTLYSSGYHNKEREKLTISARIVRCENQLNKMDQKLDQVLFMINSLLKSKTVNEYAQEDEV